ncbi:RHS repeat-associated core domain-containing protein [Sandaracinus amylolyticus]|uniref:RHS repeat-associated core domain-containing protein n=1 Tax=Sandaracinus amylolyticus TaxID=927083 RepID=UPI001F414359|nr:RHS repeat-associated core domain-containing protein [Sandaracinus amylolyticus]UJR86766.1 Hypothetical protein I5071_88670 [Sandaracinus amylolyticus]
MGITQGVPGVTPDGASTYTIPIAAPAGPAGFQPSIALSYNSRAGSSAVGVGWSIVGVSAITRCPYNLARDGQTGGVQFDDDDALCLDGQRLIPMSGEYMLESGLERAKLHGELHDPDSYFVVHLPNGGRRIFGGPGASFHPEARELTRDGESVVAERRTFQWLIAEERDASGNVIEYDWTAPGGPDDPVGEPRIESIRYGGFVSEQDALPRTGEWPDRVGEIDFVWETNDGKPIEIGYQHGVEFRRTAHLATIATRTGIGPERTLREYQLGGRFSEATDRWLLTDVRECDHLGVCLDPVSFRYSGEDQQDELKSSSVMAAPSGWWEEWFNRIVVTPAPAAIVPTDVNGDGVTDILYWEETSDHVRTHWYVRLGRWSGQYGPEIDARLPETPVSVGMSDVRPIDFDRDGDDELIFRRWDGDAHLWRTDVFEWGEDDDGYWEIGSDFDGCEDDHHYEPPYPALVGDFDGNGASDFLASCLTHEEVHRDGGVISHPLAGVQQRIRWHANADWFVYHAVDDVDFVSMPEQYTELTTMRTRSYVLDSDGDGVAEVLLAHPATRGFLARMRVRPDAEPTLEQLDIGLLPSVGHVFLDANGDGLADLMTVRSDGDIGIRANTGRGFHPIENKVESDPDLEQYYRGRTTQDIRVLDYNGDGRQDFLLLHEGNEDGSLPPAVIVNVATADDEGRVAFHARVLPVAPGFQGYPRNWATTQVIDANGDRVPDLVSIDGETVRVHIAQRELPDILQAVSGDHPQATTFEYSRAHAIMRRAVGCSYPISCATPDVSVVTASVLPNDAPFPLENQHDYSEPRTDVRGRGWLGFELVWTSEGIANASEVQYDLHTPFSTEPEGERWVGRYSYVGARVPIREWHAALLSEKRIYVVEHRRDPEVIFLTGDHSRYLVRTRLHETREFEVQSDALALPRPFSALIAGVAPIIERAQTTQWDEHGFSERVESRIVGATTEVIETPRRNRPEQWIFGLPELVRVRSWPDVVLDPGTSGTREITPKYDDRGRLYGFSRAGSSAADYLEIYYGRDSRGNITYTSSSGAEPLDPEGRSYGSLHRESWVRYDRDGVYPIELEDALHRITTLQHHHTSGALQRVTDANNLVHRAFFDGFGRVTREDPATGGAVLLRYLESPDRAVRVDVEAADGSRSTIDVDSFGRTRRTRRSIHSGTTQRWSVVSRTYDSRGRLSGVTLPAFEGEGAESIVLTYDALDRPLTRSHAGRLTQYRYDGLSVRITNPRGFVKEYAYDRARRLVSADEGPDGTRTRYGYGPFGVLESVDSGDDVVWKAGYDTWGRRTTLWDPDSGAETTLYDSFGDPVYSRNAVGEIIEARRDVLGRQTRRISSVDGETSFVWDDAVDGIGRLSVTCAENGAVCTEYDYDARTGQRTRERLVVSGVGTYDTELGYDSFGRVFRIAYPEVPGRATRFALRFEYDGSGALDRVREDRTGGATFYDVLARDARAHATSEALGPMTGSRTYDAATGLLRTTRVRRPSGSGWEDLQYLGFTYDDHGNLEQRADVVSGRMETFGYDSLDRLEMWRVDSGTPTNYAYDGRGNLTHYAGVRQDFGPDGSTGFYGPHAIRQRGSVRYAYDVAGRQTSGGGRTQITYTSAGLPRRVRLTSGTQADYNYDSFGHRVRARTGSASTVYAGDLFEARTSGTTTTYVFHIFAGGRELAQITRTGTTERVSYLLTDHLGTLDAVTDSAGAVVERFRYDPFGSRVNAAGSTSATQRHRWVGHESDDATGLINMRGRMYDPQTGRFLSTDPLSLTPAVPQSLNSYSYVLNNPSSLRDSTGWWCDGLSFSVCPDGSRPSDAGGSAGASIGPGSSWGPLPASAAGSAPMADSAGSMPTVAQADWFGNDSWEQDVVEFADWLDNSGTADFLAGAGDVMTLGFAWAFREVTDVDGGAIDTSSDEYAGGVVVGAAVVGGGALGASAGGGAVVGDVLAARVLSSAAARTGWTVGTEWAYAEVAGGAALGGGVVAMTGGGGGGGGGALRLALGINRGGLVEKFASRIGASTYWNLFADTGDVRVLAANLQSAMNRASRIDFNLTGMLGPGRTAADLLRWGADGPGQGNVTNWEFFQVVTHHASKAVFHLDGRVVTLAELGL